MAVAKVTSKGQITIPVSVREALELDTGDQVVFVELEKGRFAMMAKTGSVRELKGLLRERVRKPVSIEEMNQAIRKAAARSR